MNSNHRLRFIHPSSLPHRLGLRDRHVPQGADLGIAVAEDRDALLALAPPLGILAAAELVLDHAVDDDDAELVGVDREELLALVAAVEEHRVAGLARGDDR